MAVAVAEGSPGSGAQNGDRGGDCRRTLEAGDPVLDVSLRPIGFVGWWMEFWPIGWGRGRRCWGVWRLVGGDRWSLNWRFRG
jgi:hypothetical protein